MKVSVITACFNNATTIEATLQSLKNQDYPNIEHLVQDGGSTDRTLSIVKTILPDSFIVSAPDKGIFDALNKGIDRATGDIIGILHADDFFLRTDVLSKVVEAFQHSGADAVYGDLRYVDRQNTAKVIRTWKSGKYEKGDFLRGWMPPHPAFFVKKHVIERHGAYNTSFISAADYEWMLRLIHKHNISVAYLPEFLVAMRVGGKSNKNIGNRIRANMEDRRAWEINGLQPKWYTLYWKPLSKLRHFFQKN